MNYNIIELAEDTNSAQSQKSIHTKERHGILPCASNMIKTAEGFKKCKIPLCGRYTGIDALSRIVRLMSPPAQFKPRVRRYYAKHQYAPLQAGINDRSIKGKHHLLAKPGEDIQSS